MDYVWKEHPVIRLDFAGMARRTVDRMEISLNAELDAIARRHTCSLEQKLPEDKFKELIEKLSQRNLVVILIDEYDKPILDHLDNSPQAIEQRTS